MSSIPNSIPFSGMLAPTDSTDTYATHDTKWGRGGAKTVADIAERDAITSDRRSEGMICYVEADQKTYQLLGGVTNASWTEFGGGSGGIASAEEKTFSEMEALISSSSLGFGKWYLITDYATKNDAGWSQAYEAPVEQLYVQAVSATELYPYAISKTRPTDIIIYDITNTILPGGSGYGEWNAGSDQGGDFTISNITATTFEVSTGIAIDSDLFLIVDDGNGNMYLYDYNNYGTGFTTTDLGGGQTRVNILDTIDLTASGNEYIYIECNGTLGQRKGFISYRKDIKQYIECSFDYFGARFYRRKIDTSSYSAWDSITLYTENDLVLHDGGLWMSMYANTNQEPNVLNYYWILLADNLTKYYPLTQDKFSRFSMNSVASGQLLFPAFCYYHHSSDTATLRLDMFSHMKIMSENIVFQHTNTSSTSSNVEIGLNSKLCNFFGPSKDVRFGDGSTGFVSKYGSSLTNFFVRQYIRNSYIKMATNTTVQSMSDCSFHDIYDSTFKKIIRCHGIYVNKTNIGNGSYKLNLGYCLYNDFGEFCGQSYLKKSKNNVIGGNLAYVKSESDYFERNNIGNHMINFIIYSGITFSDNIIGSECGRYGQNIYVNGDWIGNTIGQKSFNSDPNTFAGVVKNNKFGVNCYGYEFGGDVIGNTFGNDTTSIKSTSTNIFKNNVLNGIISYDFGVAATHIHNDYFCNIYNRPDTTTRLSYMNDLDALAVVAPTS